MNTVVVPQNWLTLFLLLFARVGGLFATAPIFMGDAVPLRLRAGLAAAIALTLAPLHGGAADRLHFDGWIAFAAMFALEAAIGAAIGVGILVFFHAMTMAGELVSQAAGLSLAEVFDPVSGENAPILSRLLFLSSAAVFLCIGGHRVVMAGLLDSFQAIPPGGGWSPASLGEGLTTLAGQSFALAIRAAAPAVAALLLATFTLGLVARTIPQMNVLALGFGLNALLAFAALGLTLGSAIWAFQDQALPILETLFEPLKTPLQTEWMP